MADTSFMRWALRQFYTKTQLANDALDAYYFGEDEFISTSAGAGDAGKPIVLDAGGKVDASMINDADIDHGTTTGLTDDDHTQYALLAGRSGGQTLIGGTAAGNDLTIKSSSNATKGKVIFGNAGTTAYDEVNERFGIGTASPSTPLHVVGATTLSSTLSVGSTATITTSATVPTIYGGTSSGGDITIHSTSHATKGDVILNPSGGVVGIGTSSPAQTLHVVSSATGATSLALQNDDTGGTKYILSSTGSAAAPGAGYLEISKTGSSSPNRMVYDGTNNRLGIGVANPSTTLHVVGATTLSSTLSVGSTATITTSATVPTIYGSSSANGDITIHGTSSATKATSYVLLQPSGGGVGIGLTDPGGHNLVIAEGDQYIIFNCDGGAGGTPSIVAYDNGGATTTDLEIAADVLYLNPNTKGLRLGAITTVSTASETGTAGTMCFDSSYVYFCVATDTWVRAALATW